MVHIYKIIVLLVSMCILFVVNIAGAISMVQYGKYQNWVVFNFFLVTFLTILNHNKEKRKLVSCIVILSLFTFIVELIGTGTGMPFGDYYYTNKLGIKLLEVPVFIGLFYFALIYSVSIIVEQIFEFFKILKLSKNKYINNIFYSCIISSLVTSIDYFWIEKVAIKLDWWAWIDNSQVVPTSNYLSWFIICFISVFIFRIFHFSNKNYLPWAIVASMLTFFIIVLKM